MKHGNWVGGEVGPARGNDSFAVPAPSGSPQRDRRWPRSGAEDVAHAVPVLVDAAERWCRLPVGERARGLRAVLRQVEADLVEAREVDAHLGLAEGETDELSGLWRAPLERRVASSLSGGRDPAGSAGGRVAVIAPDWTDLVAGIAHEIVRHTRAGRALLLLPDARFPHVGDLWARAWVRRSPVPELLAVLQGGTPELWGIAGTAPAVTHASLSGCEERVAAWSGHGPSGESDLDDAPEVDLRVLRNASACVHRDDNVGRRAARIVDAAFGRHALSGQRPGQIARVFCHERVLSEFTAALLEHAERVLEQGRELPWIDRDACQDLSVAAKLGLDEGATLILGDPDADTQRGERPWVRPAVFTNVEPDMRVVARTRPAPLLSLVRTRTDADATELQRAFAHPTGP